MIIYVKQDTNQKQLDTLIEWLNKMGVEVHTMAGAGKIILGLLGNTENIDIDLVQGLECVQKVSKSKNLTKAQTGNFILMIRLSMSAESSWAVVILQQLLDRVLSNLQRKSVILRRK